MRIHFTLARLPIAVCGLIMVACTSAPTPPPAASWTPSERQTTETSIGYASVADALTTLRSRGDVDVSEQNGWTIISEPAKQSLWSFTPPNHPAHPAAVRRTVVQQGSTIGVQMSVLCQAERAACDKLVAEFQTLNERMRQDIQRRTP
jgi:hypothetical protein